MKNLKDNMDNTIDKIEGQLNEAAGKITGNKQQ